VRRIAIGGLLLGGADGDRRGQFDAVAHIEPGRNLAFLEAKSALSMIARNFQIELDHSAGPVRERFNFAMVPQGLRVRLTERPRDERLAPVTASEPETAPR
jgi:hypothetical protein